MVVVIYSPIEKSIAFSGHWQALGNYLTSAYIEKSSNGLNQSSLLTPLKQWIFIPAEALSWWIFLFFFFFFPQYLAHMSLSWKEKKGGKNSRCWTRKPWWWNQPFDYLLILIHKTALQVASGGLNANLALPVDKKCSQMSFVTGFPMGINGLQEELFLSSRERYSSPDSKLYHRKLFDKCFIIWFPQICSTRLVGTQSDLLQQASMVTLRTLVFRKVIVLKKDKMLVEY